MNQTENPERLARFRRNPELESLIHELNSLLAPAEGRMLNQFLAPSHPILFVVGCPRSGTTLLTQWLAMSQQFTYPSNFVSRFYRAPYIGAKIQRMIADPSLAFCDEMSGIDGPESSASFHSALGKTRGYLAPNEFWYFWRRFWPFADDQYLTSKQVLGIDKASFRSELAALESVSGKPLMMKAMIAQWHLPLLASIFPRAIFLYIKRHPFFTMQSLLKSRERFYGDQNSWYSFKPPEYRLLATLHPLEQVAGQVYYTNQAIRAGLNQLSPSCSIEINYTDFCSSPAAVWESIAAQMARSGFDLQTSYAGPACFPLADHVRLSNVQQESLIRAYHDFSGENITPRLVEEIGREATCEV